MSRARCDLMVDTTETQISALPLFTREKEGRQRRGFGGMGEGWSKRS